MKYKSLNKKKVFLIITEKLLGSASTVSSNTLSILNSGLGVIISTSSALSTSIAILITTEYLLKSKIRYTKVRDWVNLITLLYEKSLIKSMIVKKFVDKKALEFKKFYTHHLDEREEIMKNTQFKLAHIFVDIISKENFSPEQITELNDFSQSIVCNNFCRKLSFFKPKNEKVENYEPNDPPDYE